MDDFANDLDGDQIIASLSFDEESELSISHQTPFTEIPTFKAPTRTEFPGFPYSTPYPQQVELMRFIYSSLASSKCGIVESPTGTGKSATLLTSCLHWLLDHNSAIKTYIIDLREYLQKESDRLTNEADWVAAHSRKRILKNRIDKEIEPLEGSQKALAKASELIRQGGEVGQVIKTTNFADTAKDGHSSSPEVLGEFNGAGDDSFLPLVDTDSDKCVSHLVDEADIEEPHVVQVIYCSRTHSQLAQIVEELGKLKGLSKQVTMVTLASRQILCVNKGVFELKNQNIIREACLDLSGKSPGCKFRCRTDVNRLSDYLLGTRVSAIAAASLMRNVPEPVEIEDLPLRACPYYANKKSIPLAQIILAPYQTVVVPDSRRSVGLSLRNNVLIFDEAHNLLEAVAASFSATVSYIDLLATERIVRAFLAHYRLRLSCLSVLRLRQLLLVVKGFANLLEGKKPRRISQSSETESGESLGEVVYTLADFLFAAGLDHINLGYLVDYLRSGRCVHKIMGFGKWFASRQKGKIIEESDKDYLKPVGSGLRLSECLKQLKRPQSNSDKTTESMRSKRLRSDGDRQVMLPYLFTGEI